MQLTITFPSDDRGYGLMGNILKEYSDYRDLVLHSYNTVRLTMDGKKMLQSQIVFLIAHNMLPRLKLASTLATQVPTVKPKIWVCNASSN